MKNAGFYHLNAPVMLASGSTARRQLLQPIFPDIVIQPCADSVEDALKITYQHENASTLAQRLAEGKAVAASADHHRYVVIGADQTCDIEGRMLSKRADKQGALEQLSALQGKTHALHSAVAVARDGLLLGSFTVTASLTMAALSEDALIAYIDAEQPFKSVSSYLYEGIGRHLFTEVQGEYETILGLPVNPLLALLRRMDIIRI